MSTGALELSVADGLLSMVDTEEKQLQAIEDLYQIMIAQPRYAKLGGKQWNEKTQPITVLLWILRKLGALALGEDWTIDTYQESGRTRYQLVIYKGYAGSYQYTTAGSFYPCKENGQYLALDFLPFLVERDQPLHDIIVDAVALVSKFNKVPFWWEDDNYSLALDQVVNDPYYMNERAYHRSSAYMGGGIATNYRFLFELRRRKVKPSDLEEKIRNYKQSSQRKERICWWAKLGLWLAEEARSMVEFTYVPAYQDRHRLFTPDRQGYKFIWSKWEHDPVEGLARPAINHMDRERWSYAFTFTVTRPGRAIKPLIHHPFPSKLDYFMNQGDRLFAGTHKDYFYNPVIRAREEGQESPLLINILT